MKLSRTDIEIIELKNKVELLVTERSKERLKKVLNKSKRLMNIGKVKEHELS